MKIKLKQKGKVECKFENGLPVFHYNFDVFHEDKFLMTIDYHMGIGHFNPFKYKILSWNSYEYGGLYWKWKDEGTFPKIKKSSEKDVAKWIESLARTVDLKADEEDVIVCLFLDTIDTDLPFEDWAENMGCSSDSIKAKKLYDLCDERAKILKSNLSQEEFENYLNWALIH